MINFIKNIHYIYANITNELINIKLFPDNNTDISLSVHTVILLTFLFLLPSIILLMSSFTRIIIVLSILRNALGLQSSPPNQILLGLSLCLTFFVMSPICNQIYYDAYIPFNSKKITLENAIEKSLIPLKKFMIRQTRKADLLMYSQIGKFELKEDYNLIPMKILIPSFITSELKTAFQIGFTLFIPFLIIDLVVSSILMSLGMMMLPPTTTSLPFKLMFFVIVDGWQLLLGSLVQSFR